MSKYVLGYTWVLFLFSCNKIRTPAYKSIDIDHTPAVLLSGLPDGMELNARNAAARKYGFHFKWAAGCVVSKILGDSIRCENTVVYEMLSKLNGKNWRKHFEEDLEKYYVIQQVVDSILHADAAIAEKNATFFDEEDMPFYRIECAGAGIAIVNVCNGIPQSKEWVTAVYYAVAVDIEKRKIIGMQ